MDNEDILTAILTKMYDFQREHDITQQCLTNAIFLHSYIKKNMSGYDCRLKAVLVVENTTPNLMIFCSNHMVMEINGRLIDPSYEYHKLANPIYYDSYQDCMDKTFNVYIDVEKYGPYKGTFSKKKYLNSFNRFVKIEQKINTKNIIAHIDNEYYGRLVGLFR